MKEWLLSECCSVIADGDHAAPPKSEQGVPFITIRNFDSHNSIDFTNTMFVTEEYYQNLKSSRKARKDDILYSVVGSFGIPILIRDNKPFIFQRHIALLRPNTKIVNPIYLYHLLRSETFYAVADILAVGSAQRTITLTALRRTKISLPDIKIQDRIGNILSDYDDLIELNRRRIAILEEMAMRTYQEWFVHFRFPGHETTEFINGLPAGWEDGVLGQLAKFKRGKNITIAEAIEGEYPVVAGGINPSCYHNDYNAIAPVVTVSASGANAGFTRLYQTNVWAADCSFIDKKCPNIYFVYCFLKLYSAITENLQRGSAQPHVHAKDLNAIKLVIPAQETIKKFNSFVKALFDEIHLIETQNTKLQNMRDRLLPQLMSGQLEVTPNDEAL